WMRIPVEFLVICCLVVGMVPAFSIGVLLDQAVRSVLHERTPVYDLALWHGFNLPLLMSCLALVLGLILFVLLWRYADLRQISKTPVLSRLNGKAMFESFMLNLVNFAGELERLFGTRRLQAQLFCLLLVGLLAMLLVGNVLTDVAWPWYRTEVDIWFGLVWLMGAACAVAAAWKAKFHRLVALMLAGGVGVATSLTFLWFSAPDLALTQLVVETVTIVLLLLGLRWLPPRIVHIDPHQDLTAKLRRIRDFILATLAGLAMAVISYAVMMKPGSRVLSDFYLSNALPGGGGLNVVNVLLVDFRSFDTMGEITVLSIVALTVFALLRRFRPTPESAKPPVQQSNAKDPASQQSLSEQLTQGYLWIPSVYLQWLLPVIIVVALYLFMRGHNLPGGGFIAGLVLACALIAQYMLGGTLWMEQRFRLRLLYWIGSGLLLALFTGLGAWLYGFPLLTTHTAHWHLPILGEVHVPTAFFFDLGVFAAVVGTTMLILVALAHQALRTLRPEQDEQPNEGALKHLRERGLQ
ncbi:MAG: hydrogen gas-evolving membrane-bound hydrogenase subunit E, partial [Venatoribacter sp.]